MAKDPAFLFYSSDFLVGTYAMTNEQVGIYVKLLCIQHQHGGYIEKDFFNSMVNGFPMIRSKFLEGKQGFYNERLNDESTKRNNYVNSRRDNAKHMHEHMHEHMPKHMENENENKDLLNTSPINPTKKERHIFIKPNIEDISNYCKERKNTLDPESFFNFYESKGWKVGNQPMKDWKAAIRTWEKRNCVQDMPKKEARQTVPSAEQTDKYLASIGVYK